MNNLDKKLEQFNRRLLEGGDKSEARPEPRQVRDMYDERRKTRRIGSYKAFYGTRPYVKRVLEGLDASPVSTAKIKAKNEYDYLKKIGDKKRAEMLRQQYMEDYYLPTVDAAVRLSSKQDILSSQAILDKLDSYVILPTGSGSGYTAAFVGQMYEDGVAPSISDIEVTDTVRDVKRLCEEGDIVRAITKAKRMKKAIERGDNVAIPEDYEIIEKVAIRG